MNDDNPHAAPDPTVKRRRTMRWLLVLLAVVVSVLVAIPVHRWYQRAVFLESVRNRGGLFLFHGGPPDWLYRALGEKWVRGFASPHTISIHHANDDDLRFIVANYNLTSFSILDSPAVTEKGWESIRALKDLEDFGIKADSITDEQLQLLKDFPRLSFLGIISTKALTETQLSELSQFPHLETLILENTPFGDDDLAKLTSLDQLISLSLEGTHITDAGMAEFRRFPKLEQINLNSTAVTDAGLKELESLTRLTALNLKHTAVTQEGIDRLQQALPGCEIRH